MRLGHWVWDPMAESAVVRAAEKRVSWALTVSAVGPMRVKMVQYWEAMGGLRISIRTKIRKSGGDVCCRFFDGVWGGRIIADGFFLAVWRAD